MSEEQKEMQVEAAEKAAKKVAPVTTAEPEENFDWDAYENDAVVPASEKDALTQKYAETLSKVGEKEVVEGTVISMNKREVVVNIGYKSDGIISLNEFRYNPELKVGDKVEVYVETQEDKKRSVDPFTQTGSCSAQLGSCERSVGKRRNHQRFC